MGNNFSEVRRGVGRNLFFYENSQIDYVPGWKTSQQRLYYSYCDRAPTGDDKISRPEKKVHHDNDDGNVYTGSCSQDLCCIFTLLLLARVDGYYYRPEATHCNA